MKQVSRKSFEKGIEPYVYEGQYMKACLVKYPSIKAYFEIPHSVYVKDFVKSGHLNSADLNLCYNQMGFSGIYELARLKQLPNFSKDFFNNLENNLIQNSVITKIKNLQFKKSVNPVSFSIDMNIDNLREGELSIFQTSFNIQNKIFGEIDLAFIKSH